MHAMTTFQNPQTLDFIHTPQLAKQYIFSTFFKCWQTAFKTDKSTFKSEQWQTLSISAGIILKYKILAEYLLWNWIIIIPNTTKCNFSWKVSQMSYFWSSFFLSFFLFGYLLINGWLWNDFVWKHGSRKTHWWGKKEWQREGGLEPSQYWTSIHPFIPYIFPSTCPVYGYEEARAFPGS